MSRKNILVVLAGVALGTAGAAFGQSADAGRSYSAELRGDASTRTSTLAQPGTFTPKVGGWITLRYDVNVRAEAPPPVAEDVTNGFQARYTKMYMEGNIFNDRWGYRIQGQFMRTTGAFILDDAWGSYKFDNGWSAMWGQFKLPILKEENIADTRQLAADRSVMNQSFTQNRSQGIQVMYMEDSQPWRFIAAFSDGARTLNTDFDSNAEADWAFTGRVDWKWQGDWKDFDQFTSFKNNQAAGYVGGAVHYQSGGDTGAGPTGVTSDTDVLIATVDSMIKGSGWNVYGALVFQTVDSTAFDAEDYGLLLQGGIFVDNQWELFARYDGVFLDNNRTTADDTFSTVTVGTNYYFIEGSHAAKFTLDGSYFVNSGTQNTGLIPTQDTTTGFLTDTDDGQFNIRAQIQLMF